MTIRSFSHRRVEIVGELARIATVLTAWATHDRAAEGRPPMSPLVHYSMLDAPECGCVTCVEWETRRAEFVDAALLVPKGHKWTICGCPDCRFVGRIQLNYLAATNRRDLLIEMSFHARYHSRHGGAVMAWLEQEMRNPAYTVNWCAQEMSRFPLDRWIRRCEMAVSGAVSGVVFTESAGITRLESHIGSSLGEEVGGMAGWL